MRQKTLHYLLVLAVAGIGLTGCRSDVKLDEVTVESRVNVQFQNLPIGEVSTTFGDLIGLVPNDTSVIISKRDSDGVLVLTIRQHYEREFHNINLKDYIGRDTNTTYLRDQMPELIFIPKDEVIKVQFPVNITFRGINNDLSDERLDKMVIQEAKFTTRFSSSNLNITNADIQSVTLLLNDQFQRAKGKEIPLDDFELDKDVPVTIDDFTLIMMKDTSAAPSNTNVVNTATFYFVVTIKTKDNVPVYDNSGFYYTFAVDFLEYIALYGFFEAGDDTSDKDVVDVPIRLPKGDTLILPIKDPDINMQFTHGLGIPLQLRVRYLKAINDDGTEIYAKWIDKTTGQIADSTIIALEPVIYPDDSLDKTIKDTIIFDKTPEHGEIDRFFTGSNIVDKLGYDYSLEVNKNRLAQCRLTQNRHFTLDFNFTMPFEFNPGLKVVYADTIKDITLERVQLDSLAALTKVLDSITDANLTLYLTFTNNIPISLKIGAQFFDGQYNELTGLPKVDNIVVPSAVANPDGSVIAKDTIVTIAIQTEHFNKLAETRAIRISGKMVNDDDNNRGTAFKAESKLSVKAGVTGDVKALLNLKNLGNNTNSNNNNQ